MAKFDLMGMLSERSIQETEIPEQKIVYRSPEDLIPDKENFYSTESLEKLKESIKLLGLLQPLLIENRDGKDYIVAGHCRQKCCLELLKEGEERFQKIPCIYTVKDSKDPEEDEIIKKIRLIQANTYREKSDWEKMTEALQMEELVKELRKKVELEGKSREITADLIGVSSTQIGRYRSINSNLSEDLMAEFKESRINLSTAAELAGLKPEYQQQAYEIFLRDGMISANDAKVLKARQEQENIPGQMTIEQALHPKKPEEVDTIIPVDIQIERFYETLRKNIATYILKSDLNMSIYMLSALYGSVRVRNGHLNYQGKKEGILFNPGSGQEELVSWEKIAKKLIEKYGKKQKPIKTVSVDAPEKQQSTPVEHQKSVGPARCITGKSGSGICGTAAYCDKPYKCCSQCPEDCNIRCGWIEERKENFQPAAENAAEKQQGDHFVEDNKIEDHSGEDTEMVSDPENQIPEAWPEYLRDIPIPTDTEITDYLYRQERDLRQMLEIEKEDPRFPHMTVMKQQMLVAGLRLIKNLLHDCQEPEQSPLPEMRNNDQRKEWLRNYKSWGLWYEDKHTGIKYYKYDFENGARLIAEEFQPDPEAKTQWYTPGESYYLHLVGGPKPKHRNDKGWTYHSRYDKYPNSETELIEFLKEIQR